MTMRRIAFFLPNLQPGGAERIVVRLANHFVKCGHIVDLLVGNIEGKLLDLVDREVNIHSLGRKSTAGCLVPLIFYFRRHSPYVVLSTIMHANVVVILAARLSMRSIRVCIRESGLLASFNGRPLEQGLTLIPRIASRVYPLADANICVSSGVKMQLNSGLKLEGRPPVYVICNPIPAKSLSFRRNNANFTNFDSENNNSFELKLVSVGRLEKIKDYATLVRALAIVNQTRSCRLTIYGEGSQRVNLRQIAQDLCISNKLELPGYVEHPYGHVVQHDIFVLSSRFEGMPNALLEAMAMNMPCISSNINNGPIEDLKCGDWPLLFNVEDPNDLAQRILEVGNRLNEEITNETWIETFSLEKHFNCYQSVLLKQ